jgi:hypothetical protein
MARRVLDPKIRSVLMQSLLVVVFLCAIGLAALVTRHVRASMRVELAEARPVGRLLVRLPTKWLSSPATPEKGGDGVEAEEPPGEQQAGRRLRVMRQHCDDLAAPLEHLVRSGQIKAEVVKSLADGREGFALSDVTVAGWPGQLLTMTSSPRAGVLHKDVVACAAMPGGQAVVVWLEGLGPLDASDRELVRQMCETVVLTSPGGASAVVPEAGATAVELVEQIKVNAPAGYVATPIDDPNDLQRHLLLDAAHRGGGARGGASWVAVDLVSCVYFADDRDETFLAMLAARDPDWRSSPVRHVGRGTLVVDRADAPLAQQFPARAYLTTHEDGRALLAVLRGGTPRDQRLFDSAWQSLAGSVRFDGAARDLSSLLTRGADAARRVADPDTLAALVPDRGAESWFLWDSSENAAEELWAQTSWRFPRDEDGFPADELSGTRTSQPAGAYGADTQFEQQWSASSDLSRYQATTYREVRRGGGKQFPRQTLEQRFTLERGRITLASGQGPSIVDAPAPAAYVPGAVVPMVVRELIAGGADDGKGGAARPALVRTESFVGLETAAPPGLLTLLVTTRQDAQVRLDERGDPMECVSVSVNGTGQVSRWYYGADRGLKFIDFARGIKGKGGK